MSVYFTKLLKEIWDDFDKILFKKKKSKIISKSTGACRYKNQNTYSINCGSYPLYDMMWWWVILSFSIFLDCVFCDYTKQS